MLTGGRRAHVLGPRRRTDHRHYSALFYGIIGASDARHRTCQYQQPRRRISRPVGDSAASKPHGSLPEAPYRRAGHGNIA